MASNYNTRAFRRDLVGQPRYGRKRQSLTTWASERYQVAEIKKRQPIRSNSRNPFVRFRFLFAAFSIIFAVLIWQRPSQH